MSNTHVAEVIAGLAGSDNHVAAGLGITLQALASAASSMSSPSTSPILIEFGHRTMVLGRNRLASMTGRNAFAYLKSKFGLSNATTPLYLQAMIAGHRKAGEAEVFFEIDMEAWEEIVPYIEKLRIIT